MDRKYLVSNNIRSAGYYNGVLEIEFNSGNIYQYLDVPEHIFTSLINAESKGGFFHNNIVNRYRFLKIR